MHQVALVLSVLLALLTSPLAAGDIFVYKGTYKLRGSIDALNAIPAVSRFYLVLDFETGEGKGVIYYVKNGKKKVVTNVPVSVTRATLPNAKAATVITYGSVSETNVNDFDINAVVMQGADVPLKVETQPVTRTAARPRTFIGSGASARSDTGENGTFQLVTYHLVFQQALTLDANNNDKTVTTVTNEIDALLGQQGYQNP